MLDDEPAPPAQHTPTPAAEVDSIALQFGDLSSLQGVDAILVPGGFGDRGFEGKVNAIRYARENGIPYLGICYGMQLTAQTLSELFEPETAAARAFFVLSQSLAAGMAIMQAHVAAVAALAPPPVGLGPVAGAPLSAATLAFGYTQAAAIAMQVGLGHRHGTAVGQDQLLQ